MSPDTSPGSTTQDAGTKPKTTLTDSLVALILSAAILTAVVLSIVAIWRAVSPLEKLKLATGYALLIVLFFFAITVLLDIIRNRIDLGQILEELSGGASMSRFQLLIFTFVVAFSFFVVVVNNKGGSFPEIPSGVLALLGVSASTYAVSKGLQVSSGDVGTPAPPPSKAPTAEGNTK